MDLHGKYFTCVLLPLRYTNYCTNNKLIFQGLWNGIIGPTLLDLQTRTNTNKEEIAQSLIGRSVGSVSGNIVAGFIFEVFIKRTGKHLC